MGKGKGDGGKGKGGKKKGNRDGQDSGTESDGAGCKLTKDYPGTPVKDVPKEKRCCLHYLWVKPDGTSFCSQFRAGKECWNPHLPQATPEMARTNLYARLKAEYGKPNCPKEGPKKPAAPAQPANGPAST